MKILKIQLVLIMLFTFMYVNSQDLHLSQFDASPIIINPSYTGMYNESDFRITNQYRSQWNAITRKSFLSSILTYDMPIREKWGAGAYIINDNSAGLLNSFSFVLSGAHDITVGNQEKHKMSVGLQFGIIYKSFNFDNFLYDNQYSEGMFDSFLPSGEVFEIYSRLLPEANIGVSYRNIDNSIDFNPYIGFSVIHALNPKDNLTNMEESRLPTKFVLNGGTKYFISDKIILDPKFLAMMQSNNYEFIMGLESSFELSGIDLNLIGGASYRYDDAVITTLGIFYNNVIYRVSYDFNVSELRRFTNYKGGLEFSIVFLKLTRTNQRIYY